MMPGNKATSWNQKADRLEWLVANYNTWDEMPPEKQDRKYMAHLYSRIRGLRETLYATR